jgi:hypothetical protein
MSATTSWIHGNALRVEDPGEYANVRHRGWGSELNYAGPRDDEDGQNLSLRWCHIGVPTPTPVDGVEPELGRIFVLYKTDSTSDLHITQIDVYDAGNKLGSIPLGYDKAANDWLGSGDHLNLDKYNQFAPPVNRYRVQNGIGLSFACLFTVIPPNEPETPATQYWQLTIAAVGVEFIWPIVIEEERATFEGKIPLGHANQR